jgi:hypothetical protein
LRIDIPVTSEVRLSSTHWQTVYTAQASARENPAPAARGQAAAAVAGGEVLKVTHSERGTNLYEQTTFSNAPAASGNPTTSRPAGAALMTPFAGSDFWLADLGLEFFHWPEQRLTHRTLKRSRECHVLESVNPQPAPGGYARVVSWIDVESGGILNAEAYDSRNRLVKEFISKDFQKVNGEWMLREMEIMNKLTGSRTTIEFNLDSR